MQIDVIHKFLDAGLLGLADFNFLNNHEFVLSFLFLLIFWRNKLLYVQYYKTWFCEVKSTIGKFSKHSKWHNLNNNCVIFITILLLYNFSGHITMGNY